MTFPASTLAVDQRPRNGRLYAAIVALLFVSFAVQGVRDIR